jgi:hypothetical protein
MLIRDCEIVSKIVSLLSIICPFQQAFKILKLSVYDGLTGWGKRSEERAQLVPVRVEPIVGQKVVEQLTINIAPPLFSHF